MRPFVASALRTTTDAARFELPAESAAGKVVADPPDDGSPRTGGRCPGGGVGGGAAGVESQLADDVPTRNDLRRSVRVDHDLADGEDVRGCHSVEHTRQCG